VSAGHWQKVALCQQAKYELAAAKNHKCWHGTYQSAAKRDYACPQAVQACKQVLSCPLLDGCNMAYAATFQLPVGCIGHRTRTSNQARGSADCP
jgi:hypothetical protein